MRITPLSILALCGISDVTLGDRTSGKPRGIWRELAEIPNGARQEHSTVALSDTTLAILGGIVPLGDGITTTNLTQLYDIPSDSWRTVADLPIPLNHINAAALNGKIYVLGGLAVLPNGTWSAIPDSWVYDPEEDQWNALPPVPAADARGSAAVGVYKDLIYLAGGDTVLVPGGWQDSIDTVMAYNTKSQKWLSVPEAARHIPEGRDHSASSVVDSTFYVIAGRHFGQHNGRGTVFSLDLKKPEKGWKSSRNEMPIPRGGLSVGTIGKSIYVFGGEGNPDPASEGVYNDTHVLNTKTGRWAQLKPMSLPRHGTAAVAAGGCVYIPGGGTRIGGAPVNNTNAYCPL